MKRTLLAGALLVLGSCNGEMTVNVGGAVQGIVVQAGNITITVSGVTITLQGRSTMSSSSGRFWIGDLKTGDHMMTLSKPGYQQKTVPVRVLRDEFTNLQIELVRE